MKISRLILQILVKLARRKRALIILSIIFTCLFVDKKILKRDHCNVSAHFNPFINTSSFKFIFNPEFTCTQRPVYLAMVIKSRVNHFLNREVLRNTWAQQDEHGLVRRVFTIGLPKPSHETNMILNKLKAENDTFGDLVQQDFYDDYYNNTLKTMMAIRWASEFCSQVFENIFKL